MSESAPTPSPDDPFDFEPVPSASRRHDGWTPERQRLFIAALRQIGTVSAAASVEGMRCNATLAVSKGPDWRSASAYRKSRDIVNIVNFTSKPRLGRFSVTHV